MIVKMKKYTFLVYHKQYLDFLERIKDIGVLHVIEKPEGITENDALREKMHLASRVKHVLKQLERLRPKDAALSPADPHRNGLDVLARVEEVLHEQEHLQQQLAQTGKERDRMEVWGRFSHKRIEELRQAGIILTCFSCPARKFDPEWETAYHAFEIDQIGSTLYFVTVTRPGETVDIDADRITLSDRTAEEWIDELVRLQEAIDRCHTRLERMAVADYNTLKEAETDVLTDVSFNKVLLNTAHEADDKVMLLEGWVPEEAVASLNAYLDGSDIDRQALRIFGGHFWQKDWFPELGDGEFGISYIEDMTALVSQICSGQAAREPSGLDHPVLDTYFRYGSAIVVWNSGIADEMFGAEGEASGATASR